MIGVVQVFAGVGGALLAAVFALRALPQDEAPLEPSVQNEVDHAVARAERWLARQPERADGGFRQDDLFGTNGLSRAEIALVLVSSQRGEGWWVTPTNTVPTRTAVHILKGL